MAYRDGTGPEGLGPLTGKGFGSCTKEESTATPAGYHRGYGLGRRCGGRGMRCGFGPGMGRRFYRSVDRQSSLNDEREMLKRRLAEIEDLIEKSE